jgi:hypothetical protein
LIESIYLDVAGPRTASRYTLLIERLHSAQTELGIHLAMSSRVRRVHENRIERVRRELEAEGERLRKIVQHANK